jgi:hypothetical protein
MLALRVAASLDTDDAPALVTLELRRDPMP